MRALVLTTNYRNVDNWLGLFQRINETDGWCGLASLPWTGDPSHADLDAVPLPLHRRQPIDRLSPDGISEDALGRFLDEICTPDIDVLFLCDMQAYPSNAVHRLLRARASRPMVIGLQHGLFQSWWVYNRNFCADHLLCFGERHRRELLPALRESTVAVGLPKLDRLARVKTADGGYILYLAQKIPESSLLLPLLRGIEAATGLPVVVRNHPQYPDWVDHKPSLPLPSVDGRELRSLTYEDQLANADWVMTPHSTGGLEALYMRKPVVLVPNAGLTAWASHPGIAWNFSVEEALAACRRADTEHSQIAGFLDDAIGGLRFDHTERALNAVQAILATGLRPPL
ncbi:MAG: hypothetical protein QM698_06695 [Micropepsaceae bacterium]